MYNNFLDNNEDIPKEKIGFKDLVAIMIAQFTIIMPMVLIAFAIWAFLIWFIVYVLMGA